MRLAVKPPPRLEVLEDRSHTTPSDTGFIRVKRLRLRTVDAGDRGSEPFAYDVVDRKALDAVTFLLHAPRDGAPGDPWVLVRTALRPPVALRAQHDPPLALPDARTDGWLWELPAGLIEAGETGAGAITGTAAREAQEETGYTVAPEAFATLGAPVYLSPGMSGEKLYFVHAAIDRDAPRHVTADEAVEAGSECAWWTLADALAKCDSGEIEDCKTHLALLRFARVLVASSAPGATS